MDQPASPHQSGPDRLTVILRWVVAGVLGVILLGGAWYAYAYKSSLESIRHPKQAHFHFRMQVINNGQRVNFGDAAFQTEFNKDICTADLTKSPVHFHDNLDQFVHIHWKGITGGILLKNYGWNLIGGTKNTLGYRFDKLPMLVRVPIHGHDLPAPAAGTRYFIYTGDASGYVQRDWGTFLYQDLEDFFAGKKTTSLLNLLIPGADAHNGEEHATPAEAATHSEEELTKINNVVGNVVIFAQKTQPTGAEITARFKDLVPLPESACGG